MPLKIKKLFLILLTLLTSYANAQGSNGSDFATFEVTLPTGEIYEVSAPDNTTDEELYRYVQTHIDGNLSKTTQPEAIKKINPSVLTIPAIVTLLLAAIFTFYIFFSKLDKGQKIRLLIVVSVAWSVYFYVFITQTINEKYLINTMPVWLFWSFYFIKGKKDLNIKFSLSDYAGSMTDYDIYVPGKRNLVHIIISFLTTYFVLFFLPKDGILGVLPIALIAITAWLIAVLPLNIAKEKKLITNNKQQNIWLAYCFLAWPIALVHSIINKKSTRTRH